MSFLFSTTKSPNQRPSSTTTTLLLSNNKHKQKQQHHHRPSSSSSNSSQTTAISSMTTTTTTTWRFFTGFMVLFVLYVTVVNVRTASHNGFSSVVSTRSTMLLLLQQQRQQQSERSSMTLFKKKNTSNRSNNNTSNNNMQSRLVRTQNNMSTTNNTTTIQIPNQQDDDKSNNNSSSKNYSNNKSNNNKVVEDVQVDTTIFIPPQQLTLLDGFAATWWQTKERFLQILDPNPKNNQHFQFVEGAAFEFFQYHKKQLRMTQDWLDFAVEHTSKAWKQVGYVVDRNTIPYQFYVDQLLDYTQRTLRQQQQPPSSQQPRQQSSQQQRQSSTTTTLSFSAMRETLALVAFMPYRAGRVFNATRTQFMSMANLGATLTSLIRVNCGRILIVVDQNDWNNDKYDDTQIIWAATQKLLLHLTTTTTTVVEQTNSSLSQSPPPTPLRVVWEQHLHRLASLQKRRRHYRNKQQTDYTNKEENPLSPMEFVVQNTEIALVLVNCTEQDGTIRRIGRHIFKTLPMAALLGLRRALLSSMALSSSSYSNNQTTTTPLTGNHDNNKTNDTTFAANEERQDQQQDDVDPALWLGSNHHKNNNNGRQMAVPAAAAAAAEEAKTTPFTTMMMMHTRWKYIYLTEPDTVLQTKESIFPILEMEMNQGNIVVPHRLQPIPHDSDIPIHLYQSKYDQPYRSANNILPAQGPFTQVLALNNTMLQLQQQQDDENDDNIMMNDHDGPSCCDQGSYRPGVSKGNKTKCGNFWFLCGFGPNKTLEDHYRLFTYKLIRLQGGTGITTLAANAHGRQCLPQQQVTTTTTTVAPGSTSNHNNNKKKKSTIKKRSACTSAVVPNKKGKTRRTT